jgi:mannitol/fructose-specific phosphotransferase system IIA component (Ntr-type)
MQLSDFLSEKLIVLELEAPNKVEALRTMVGRMARHQAISRPEVFLAEVMARENIEPTCIGRGIAFPHTRTLCVKRPVIAFGRARQSIPFNVKESDNVQLIFVMGTPKDDANTYLQILARLCRLLRQTYFRERLLTAATPKDVINLFNEYDAPAIEQFDRAFEPALAN